MRCLALTAAVLCPLQGVYATPPKNWADSLAHFLSAPDVLTSSTLAQAITPAIRLDGAACQTARLPGSASEAPVSTSIVSYEDDQACNRTTRLVLLEFSLTASPDVLGHFSDALHAALPAPCFSGDLAPEKRRRASPRHLLAWKLPGRLVTVATQAGAPGDMSVALLQTGHAAQAGTPDDQVRQDFSSSLPAQCR